MAEVSTERFEDFKDQMFRLFDELKGAVNVLSGKIDAYNNLAQTQSKDIAILATKTEEIDRLKDKVDKHDNDIVRLDEASKQRERSTKLVFGIISAISTILGVIALLINWLG